uniref:Uncharacterized protein n=1 Tax=Rhizophora mucronata TaxID=61149 RepID=A0A2P2IR05_RHIMU
MVTEDEQVSSRISSSGLIKPTAKHLLENPQAIGVIIRNQNLQTGTETD